MKELLGTGVTISLVYNETADALIGRIKDFAVAVRENNKTMSYGCLIWAKKGDPAANSAESYLAEQVTNRSDFIKHFKVTDRGIAIALVKTNDPYANITNIKRFLIDLANALSRNSYKSCCYDCGSLDELGIYDTSGTIVQACKKCAAKNADKYSLLMDLTDGNAVPAAFAPVKIPEAPKPAAPEAHTPAPAPVEAPVLTEAAAPIAAEPVAEAVATPVAEAVATPVAEAVEAPVAEAVTEPAAVENVQKNDFSEFLTEVGKTSDAPVVESAVEKVKISSDEDVSIDELFAEKADEHEQPEQAQQPTFRTKMMTDEEYKNEFAALIADESVKEEQPAFVQKTEEEKATEAAEFAALLDEMKPDGEHIVDEEKKRLEAENKAAENADYTGFMYNESDNVEKEGPQTAASPADTPSPASTVSKTENIADNPFVISELEADTVGVGEISVSEREQEVVGYDENVAVTEIVDDSDEGDDVDIEELESTVNKPTETGGKGLEARETPLEEDGSVPLVNPTSEYADIAPSPVNGPDAVQPLESRERIRAVTDEEELRVVPVGYTESDPRADDSDPYRGEPPTPVAVPPSFMAQRVSKISFGSDPVFGIIGAVVLGALGVALWIFLNTMIGSSIVGFSRTLKSLILSLAALAISLGVFGGYCIGGEEMDMKGLIISAVINVIYDVLGIAGKYVISVQASIEKVFGFHMSLADASEWAMYQFAQGSVSFLIDFWVNVVVMLIMLVFFIRFWYKKL